MDLRRLLAFLSTIVKADRHYSRSVIAPVAIRVAVEKYKSLYHTAGALICARESQY